MTTNSKEDGYFPPPESQGGWRYLLTTEEIRETGGMDPDAIQLAFEEQDLLYGDSFSIAIIRHGYLVQEYHTFNVLPHSRFDIWSCTKTLTGTAWGLLLDDCRQGTGDNQLDLDSCVYDILPEGHPLSDPRKERITLRHLLTMTSGIPGENAGVRGMPTRTNVGPFEHALGHQPNRYGRWVSHLVGEPGQVWDYSDPAFVHLSLAFYNASQLEINDFMQERVFKKIGIDNLSWDIQGGRGFIGPHTNPHTGAHISARELARFGYLALHNGRWNGEQVIPIWWHELATQTSQKINPSYGYTWWANTHNTCWPGLPKDMFALMGFRSNRCYIIPSLDLVVSRVGSGPPTWVESGLIERVIQAVL